jgi:hypothetical protein
MRAFLTLFFLWLAALVPAQASERFYDADVGELLGEPGSIIRIEPMRGAPMGASEPRFCQALPNTLANRGF